MKMDIQTEKLRLIEWIAGLNDPKTLIEFITLKKEKEEDWWDTISEDDQAAIDEGLDQLEKGQHVSHKTVQEEIHKRFNF